MKAINEKVYAKVDIDNLSDEFLARTPEEDAVWHMSDERLEEYVRSNSVPQYLSIYAKACAKDFLKAFRECVVNELPRNTKIKILLYPGWVSIDLPDTPDGRIPSFHQFKTYDVVSWDEYFREVISTEITRILNILPTKKGEWSMVVTSW